MKDQFRIKTSRRGETTEHIFDASKIRGDKNLFVIRHWKHYVEDKEISDPKEIIINMDRSIYEDYINCLRIQFSTMGERQREKLNEWLKSLWI